MLIKFETTLLAAPSLATGAVGPFNLALNGRQLVDEVDFFRAASPVYYTRGGLGVALRFSVTRVFTTLRQAEAFYLGHWGALPRQGLLTCIAGEDGDEQTLYLRNAVLTTIALTPPRGVAVTVEYTIVGGLFESDVPSEEIPGEPDAGEESIVIRRNTVAIPSGVTSVAVVFSSALSGPPAAYPCTISRPTGGDAIWPIVRKDSVTASGFTVDLSGATPDDTYELTYIAIQ